MSDKLQEALKELVCKWYDKTHIMTSNGWSEIHADELREIIVSNPPEAQAEGWQGPWKCDKCGHEYTAMRVSLFGTECGAMPHCAGTLLHHDRRKSDDSGERYTCQDCGSEMNEGEGRTFTCCDKCWSKRYPLKGEKKWKCSNGHISTKEPVDGKCLLCGLVVGQGEEKKG